MAPNMSQKLFMSSTMEPNVAPESVANDDMVIFEAAEA